MRFHTDPTTVFLISMSTFVVVMSMYWLIFGLIELCAKQKDFGNDDETVAATTVASEGKEEMEIDLEEEEMEIDLEASNKGMDQNI